MFNHPVDDRLTEWIKHRRELDESKNPLQDVWDFWHRAPFIPHNKNIDPHYRQSWPGPWAIIEENKYDDFTKALMIGWTLKLTKKFQNSKIEIKTLVDTNRTREYNLVYVDDNVIINYSDNGPISVEKMPDSFFIENIIDLEAPR
jgi:hypothetical protein